MASGDIDTGEALAKENETENDIKQRETQLLMELQKQIKTVDVNMVELVNSFDQLHDTAKKHSHDVEVKIDTHNYDNEMEFQEYVKTTRGRMSQLLDQVNSVETYQTKVLKSLSKLIHYIHADSGEICTNKLPNKCELLIDSYLQRDKCTSEIVDALVEMLQDENSRLRERNTLYREHAALVNKRAELVCAERDWLTKELDSLRPRKASPNASDFEMVSVNDHFASCMNTDANVEQNIKTNTCGNDAAPNSTYTSSELKDNKTDDKNIADLQKPIGEAQEHNDELKVLLLKARQSLADQEELLKTVCLDTFYEVDVIYTRYARTRYVENNVVDLLKKSNVECHVKEFSTRADDANSVLLILCVAYSKDTWNEALENAKQKFPAKRSVAIVMIYNGSNADTIKSFEDAQINHVEFLSNTTIFNVKYSLTNNYEYRIFYKEVIPIRKFIHDNSAPKTKVVGCPTCAKVFCNKK